MDACALEFLGQLERAELSLLKWGLVDGFFSEAELEQRAEKFVELLSGRGVDTPHASGWDLVQRLLDERLLWKVPDTERYRTRMAEAVRLFARLRQIFPDPGHRAWRTAPNLVADYRLLVGERMYPRRDVSAADLIARVRQQRPLSALHERVIAALLRTGTASELRLAQFQSRAAERIMRAAASDRASGTVISAGTGSGKTLAFYLPAYALIAERISPDYWTKCLAIYPRNELLKDQLREALANARRVGPALLEHNRRRLVIGALYGDVPPTGRDVITPGHYQWRRLTIGGTAAYECPFVRCPRCGEGMAWAEIDIQRGVERLRCTTSRCAERVEPDEIRLTRQRMLAEPPDVLFTTTEMLNQRLSSAEFAPLFGIGVRSDRRPLFVLIDEVHACERLHGAHVALLLRRWRRASDTRPHFVGLSATLADAPRFFGELVGLGPGDVSEVLPESHELHAQGTEYMLALRGDPSSGTSLLSTTIQALMLFRRVLAAGHGDCFGSRIFAFTDDLDVTNRLYHNLLDAEGWGAFGPTRPSRAGGSLANLRATTLPNARERFPLGQNWALVEDIGHVLAPGMRARVGRTSSQDRGVDPDADIVVATAALEVGFDDPELGGVLQHKAPHSPAAFLQRKGRAGRRQDMRPWTLVVLSDYGRDRNAYQSYDQLFSPVLPPRHLPLGNRAVLRIQATYVLCDWLARRLPPGASPDPWLDFSTPASAARNPQLATRQNLYAQYLTALLEQSSVREEFAAFLARSLSIDPEDAAVVMWEPPRALITEAVPTLLRRLERGWRRTGTSELERYTQRAPLPEYLPRALFDDLQVPDVAIRLPPLGRIPARDESMPIAHALREFAPGRVSRRFGISHGGERHWIAPGNGVKVSLDTFCPPPDRQDLGYFSWVDGVGHRHAVPVFRPHAIDVVRVPADVQQSSTSFLTWHTELVPTADGHEVDLPDGSAWAQVLASLCFHTHHLGSPVEVRRFSVGATASVGRGRGQQLLHFPRFVSTTEHGDQAVGIGFASDVDAIQVRFAYPRRLSEACIQDGRLVRGLRVARFRDAIRDAVGLAGMANPFQRDWLSQVYLAAITAEALRAGVTLQAAEDAVYRGNSRTPVREVLDTILQWSEPDADHADYVDPPRRRQELAALLDQAPTRSELHDAARFLWTDIDDGWEPWLRARFKSTLAAALVEAAYSLCPTMDAEVLAVDLRGLVSSAEPHRAPAGEDVDELWLTETTIGGGGFVEELLAKYVDDPRRYLRFLDAALGASDLETVADELGRVLEMVSSASPEQAPLVAAFHAVRGARAHDESSRALLTLRAEFARRGIQPTATLLVSVNARLLGPGTSAGTDAFLAAALRQWATAEDRLAVDIDARVFALVKSSDVALEQALGVTPVGGSDAARAAWRRGVLYGMLWPRGAQLRTDSLRAWNPYDRPPDCDRLLVLAAASRSVRPVPLADEGWFDQLGSALRADGSAELVASVGDSERLAEALLRIGAEPVDAGALLVYARLTGVRRDTDQITVSVELPEAPQ